MTKKIKTLIAIGGTGGHVFPGLHLAEHLKLNNYDVNLITDKRGFFFLKQNDNFQINILPSSPLIKKNIFRLSFSIFMILYSIFRSAVFLVLNRPKIIFGMGGYASFPICVAATILKIKFIIYENNLIIGKTNKILLPFAEKLYVSYKELEGVPKRFQSKILVTGNIIKKDIINFYDNKGSNDNLKNLCILILGGSQAAKVFAEVLPEIFKECLNSNIKIKIYQHCLPNQNENLKKFYKDSNIEFEVFNFCNNLNNYFSKVNLAITRSGASILSELTNAKIPFISVPLPSSADNHQLKNAIYYLKKNFGFLVEEKDLKDKLFLLIKEIYNNKDLLDKIINNQKQYSDKNVYNTIIENLKKTINEKN